MEGCMLVFSWTDGFEIICKRGGDGMLFKNIMRRERAQYETLRYLTAEWRQLMITGLNGWRKSFLTGETETPVKIISRFESGMLNLKQTFS